MSFCTSATLSCQSGKSERERQGERERRERERERERARESEREERHTGRALTSTTGRQHTGTCSNKHMEYQYAAIVIPPPAAAEQHGRLCPPSIRNKDIVNLYSTTAAHKLVMASAQTVPGQVCPTLPPPTVRESSATCSMCIVLSILARVFLRVCDTFLPIKQEREREAARAREKERERESADRAWSSLFGSATAYRAGIIGNTLHVHRVTYPGSCLSARLRHFPANQARARERQRERERERERERGRERERETYRQSTDVHYRKATHRHVQQHTHGISVCCYCYSSSGCRRTALTSLPTFHSKQRHCQPSTTAAHELVMASAQTVPGQVCPTLQPPTVRESSATCSMCIVLSILARVFLHVCDTFLPIRQEREREAGRARERERERESEREERHTGRALTSTTGRQHTGTCSNTHMEYQYAAIVIPPPAAAEQHCRLCPPSIRNKDIVNLYSTTATHKLVMASAQTVPGQVCPTLQPPTVRESSATCSMCIVLSILARVFLHVCDTFLPIRQEREREAGRARERERERERARESEREERHTGRALTSTTGRQHTGTGSNKHMEYQYAAIVIPPPAAAEQHCRLCPPSIRNKDIVNLYSTTAAHKLVMASAQTVPGQVCPTLPPPTVRESSATCSTCIVLSILARVFLRVCDTFLPIKQEREREAARARERERGKAQTVPGQVCPTLPPPTVRESSATCSMCIVLSILARVFLHVCDTFLPIRQERERGRERERERREREIQAEHRRQLQEGNTQARAATHTWNISMLLLLFLLRLPQNSTDVFAHLPFKTKTLST